jgi:hypothetical protein
METTLFGGPPELGNMLKLANGQIGFMTIFAHPLFANVADIIPAMDFAADEILTNKAVWFTRAEQEKMKEIVRKGTGPGDGGSVSPRSQSPVGLGRKPNHNGEKRASYFPASPLRQQAETPGGSPTRRDLERRSGNTTPQNEPRRSSVQAVAGSGQGDRRSSRDSDRKARTRSREGVPSAPNGHGQSSNAQSSENDLPGLRQAAREALLNDELSGASNPSDESRDNGVSMRAGSMAVPVAADQKDAGRGGPSALGAFTFATSNRNEPVRRYDPEQHYPPVHNSARASVPSSNMMNQAKADLKTTTAHSGSNTTSSYLRGGGDDSTLTPTQRATCPTKARTLLLIKRKMSSK